MATFTRTNGDAQPVFALDIQNGAQTGNIGAVSALVQPAGPKLDFFAIVVENSSNQARDLRTELDTGEAVEAIIRAIQQTSTVAFYQVEGAASGQISVGVYPAGAFTAGTLTTLVTGLGTTVGSNSVDVSGSQATNVGFKLALS
jgi:hypothetical protein